MSIRDNHKGVSQCDKSLSCLEPPAQHSEGKGTLRRLEEVSAEADIEMNV